MNRQLTALAHRMTSWLWDEMPADANRAELEVGLTVYLATFLQKIAEEPLTTIDLAGRIRRRAKLIYDNELFTEAHTLTDEYQLRFLLELGHVALMGHPSDLDRLIRHWDSLRATGVLYLTNHPN